jgi:hypothetical protein
VQTSKVEIKINFAFVKVTFLSELRNVELKRCHLHLVNKVHSSRSRCPLAVFITLKLGGALLGTKKMRKRIINHYILRISLSCNLLRSNAHDLICNLHLFGLNTKSLSLLLNQALVLVMFQWRISKCINLVTKIEI